MADPSPGTFDNIGRSEGRLETAAAWAWLVARFAQRTRAGGPSSPRINADNLAAREPLCRAPRGARQGQRRTQAKLQRRIDHLQGRCAVRCAGAGDGPDGLAVPTSSWKT